MSQCGDNVGEKQRCEQDVQGIRAITIDLDDTLWDIGPVIRRAEAVLRQWLSDNVPEVIESHPPEQVAGIRREVITEHADMLHDLTFIRCEVLRRMGQAAGVGDGFVADAFRAFDVARNTVELFPEVAVSLESLSQRYTLVAVTNGNARLEQIGIDHWFVDCIAARDVGRAKPHVSMFEAALLAGGHSADRTLHVGDHPEHDVHGAKQAGLASVWVNRNGDSFPDELAQPDATVVDLAELDELLSRSGQS